MRKHQRIQHEDGIFRRVGAFAENFNVENHLHGHHEDNKRTGNRKRRHVQLEQMKKKFSDVEKTDKHQKRPQGNFARTDFFALSFQLQNDRHRPQNVDNRKQDDKSADKLAHAEFRKHVQSPPKKN